MKKATLSAIYSALNDTFGWFDNGANEEIRVDLEKELNRGEVEKAKNTELYEQAKDIILGALSDKPATISEIYDEVASELPEGFTKGKVQYAITRLWADEVTKVEGKTNGYCRKA